jgi:Tfp pilus assembly protein PilZ
MKKKNLRSYDRTSTLLPFQARRLLSGQREDLDCRLIVGGIVFEDILPSAVEDERLGKWLNMLNTKLDYLISLTVPEREGVVSMNFEPLNVSAGGMALIAQEPFDKGDILEIRMVLQAYPAKILQLYGEVVRVEPTPGKPKRYTVGVNFVHMDEHVRNEILKFDFKKHRERLITRKSP